MASLRPTALRLSVSLSLCLPVCRSVPVLPVPVPVPVSASRSHLHLHSLALARSLTSQRDGKRVSHDFLCCSIARTTPQGRSAVAVLPAAAGNAALSHTRLNCAASQRTRTTEKHVLHARPTRWTDGSAPIRPASGPLCDHRGASKLVCPGVLWSACSDIPSRQHHSDNAATTATAHSATQRHTSAQATHVK